MMIPANTLLVLRESALGMYGVEYPEKNLAGYVSAANTWAYPSATVDYYLLADRAHHLLYVYQLNKNGTRSNILVRRIDASFGKRTTPTIPGKYTITSRERWHYFSPSDAPFVVKFAGGKYLHGPLYLGRSEDNLNPKKSNVIGQDVTGGCIRMAYEDALWVYYHCAEGTVLEVN
jgi:lipoprotein-anchoring transpeptidase ErfK/SrfK